MKAHINSESDIAKKVIQWLGDSGWDVYQEVQIHFGGNIADIIATQDLFPSGARISWAVETKMALSEKVVVQAMSWQPMANYVSVAVPRGKRRRVGGLAERYLHWLGIGLIVVGSDVDQWQKPRLSRAKTVSRRRLIQSLRPEHKYWAEAGNDRGERYSPFKRTCKAVRRAVEENPGCTMKKLLALVADHHYQSDASFKICIAKWAGLGKVAGVRIDRQGRKLRFYPFGQEG